MILTIIGSAASVMICFLLFVCACAVLHYPALYLLRLTTWVLGGFR